MEQSLWQYFLHLQKKYHLLHNVFTNDPIPLATQEYLLREVPVDNARAMLAHLSQEHSQRDVEEDEFYQSVFQSKLLYKQNSVLTGLCQQKSPIAPRHVAAQLHAMILSDHNPTKKFLYVVCGGPCSGKTSYLKQMVLNMVGECLQKRDVESQRLPLIIDCRTLINLLTHGATSQEGEGYLTQTGLMKFIFQQQESQFSHLIESKFLQKQIILIFDGLDQIGQIKFKLLELIGVQKLTKLSFQKLFESSKKSEMIVVLAARYQLLGQLSEDFKKSTKLYQLEMSNDKSLLENLKRQLPQKNFENIKALHSKFNLLGLCSNFGILQVIIYLEKQISIPPDADQLLNRKQALTPEKFKRIALQQNVQIAPVKVGVLWRQIKLLLVHSLDRNQELVAFTKHAIPNVAFLSSERRLKDFSEIDFHSLGKFDLWRQFSKKVGRPLLKDPLRICFYLSEEISTCLDAMESWNLKDTQQQAKAGQKESFLVNRELLQKQLNDGQGIILNNFLQNCEVSFIENEEEPKIALEQTYKHTKESDPIKVASPGQRKPKGKRFTEAEEQAPSRNQKGGLLNVESCLLNESDEEGMSVQHQMVGGLNIHQEPIRVKKRQDYPIRTLEGHFEGEVTSQVVGGLKEEHLAALREAEWEAKLMGKDESTATLLMDRSPLSSQRSRLNLNAVMDAYNNLNKHPSVLAFAKEAKYKTFDNQKGMESLPLTVRASAISINPYELNSPSNSQFLLEHEEAFNRQIDIFRFISTELHNYFVAKHLVHVVRELKETTHCQTGISFCWLLQQEQFAVPMQKMQKLLVYKSLHKGQDLLSKYLLLLIDEEMSLAVYNHILCAYAKFKRVFAQFSKTTFKFSQRIVEQVRLSKCKLAQSEWYFEVLGLSPLLGEFVLEELAYGMEQSEEKQNFAQLRNILIDFYKSALKSNSKSESKLFDIHKALVSKEAQHHLIEKLYSFDLCKFQVKYLQKLISEKKLDLLSLSEKIFALLEVLKLEIFAQSMYQLSPPAGKQTFQIGVQSRSTLASEGPSSVSSSFSQQNFDHTNRFQSFSQSSSKASLPGKRMESEKGSKLKIIQPKFNGPSTQRQSSHVSGKLQTGSNRSSVNSVASMRESQPSSFEIQKELKAKEIYDKEKKLVEEVVIKILETMLMQEQVDFTLLPLVLDILIAFKCSPLYMQTILCQKFLQGAEIALTRPNPTKVIEYLRNFNYISEESYHFIICNLSIGQSKGHRHKLDADIERILISDLKQNDLQLYALNQFEREDPDRQLSNIKSLQLAFNQYQFNQNAQIFQILKFIVDDEDLAVRLGTLQSLNTILNHFLQDSSSQGHYVASIECQQALIAVPHVLQDRINLYVKTRLAEPHLQSQLLVESVKCLVYLFLLFDNIRDRSRSCFSPQPASREQKISSQQLYNFSNIVVDNETNGEDYFVCELNELIDKVLIRAWTYLRFFHEQSFLSHQEELLEAAHLLLSRTSPFTLSMTIVNQINEEIFSYGAAQINPLKPESGMLQLQMASILVDKMELLEGKYIVMMCLKAVFALFENPEVGKQVAIIVNKMPTKLQKEFVHMIDSYLRKHQHEFDAAILLCLLFNLTQIITELETLNIQNYESTTVPLKPIMSSIKQSVGANLQQPSVPLQKTTPQINPKLAKSSKAKQSVIEKQVTNASQNVAKQKTVLKGQATQRSGKGGSQQINLKKEPLGAGQKTARVPTKISAFEEQLSIKINLNGQEAQEEKKDNIQQKESIKEEVKDNIYATLQNEIRELKDLIKSILKGEVSPKISSNDLQTPKRAQHKSRANILEQPLLQQAQSLKASPSAHQIFTSAQNRRRCQDPVKKSMQDFTIKNILPVKANNLHQRSGSQTQLKQHHPTDPPLENPTPEKIKSKRNSVVDQQQQQEVQKSVRRVKFLHQSPVQTSQMITPKTQPKMFNQVASGAKGRDSQYVVIQQQLKQRDKSPMKEEGKKEQAKTDPQVNRKASPNYMGQTQARTQKKPLRLEKNKVYLSFPKRDISFDLTTQSARGPIVDSHYSSVQEPSDQSFFKRKGEQQEENLSEINKECQVNSTYQSNQSKQRNTGVVTEHQYLSEQHRIGKFSSNQLPHELPGIHTTTLTDESPMPKGRRVVGKQVTIIEEEHYLKKVELFSTIYNPPLPSWEVFQMLKQEFNVGFVEEEMMRRVKGSQKIEQFKRLVQIFKKDSERLKNLKGPLKQQILAMMKQKKLSFFKLYTILKDLEPDSQLPQPFEYFPLNINFLSCRLLEKAIEILMFEEQQLFFENLDVELVAKALVDFMGQTFSTQLILKMNGVQTSQDDEEDVIKVLYKLEILISYDSPTNYTKTKALRRIGLLTIQELVQQKVCLFTSEAQVRSTFQHFVFQQKLSGAGGLSALQQLCMDEFAIYVAEQKKQHVFYVMSKSLFAFMFEGEAVKSPKLKIPMQALFYFVRKLGVAPVEWKGLTF